MADCCGGGTRLLYACSGAADVGAMSDRVARRLSQDNFGKMTCLAAVGAELSGFIESAKAAENIVIDGCSVACGRKSLERIGAACQAFILTDMGLVKGKTPVTENSVEEITEKIKQNTGHSSKRADGTACTCNGNCE